LKANTTLKDLRSILDPVFEEELNSDMAPELLFQKYGTHLLREALMGARCTMNFTYTGTKTDTITSVETKVHAAYSYFDGSATGAAETQASELISKSHFKSILIGGKDIDASSIGKLKENFADWIATLRDYPPSIYGISNINSLIPIWDLTENKERAKQLEDYFNATGVSVMEKLEEMSKIPPEIDQTKKEYIESVVITSNKSQDKAKTQNDYASKGYILLDKDLNKGAGGNYIYIWYKKTTDPNKALTDIRFTYGDFGDIPGFYTKNQIDLNAGAGGRHIYMWTTSRSSIGKPITAIDVFYGKNANMPVGYDAAGVNYYKDGKNTRETAELNCEAGGEYIYLGISRQ